MTIDVPATLSGDLVVYSDTDAILRLLAPKGWSCTASFGADGSGAMVIVHPGETLPTGSVPPGSPIQAIEAGETGGSPVQAAAQACSFFPAAAQATETDLDKSCSSRPSRESVYQISPSAVAFEDPAGTAGTGSLSGGANPANGVITYSSTQEPGSYIDACTLPQDEHATCTTVLNYFVKLYAQGVR